MTTNLCSRVKQNWGGGDVFNSQGQGAAHKNVRVFGYSRKLILSKTPNTKTYISTHLKILFMLLYFILLS